MLNSFQTAGVLTAFKFGYYNVSARFLKHDGIKLAGQVMNFDFLDRDDFWEERLSEDKRKFYFAKFFNTDKQHFGKSKLNLVFFHSAASILSKILTRDFNLLWQYFASKSLHKNFLYLVSKVTINIHDPASWAKANDSSRAKWNALPASRFLLENEQPVIEIVLPQDVLIKFKADSDLKVNLIRLFIGEVFGKLLFDWSVLNRFPFYMLKQQKTDFKLSFVEKSIITRFFGRQDANIKSLLKKIGSPYARDEEQKINLGEAYFFNDVIYRGVRVKEHEKLINSWFSSFFSGVVKNFSSFSLLLVGKFNKSEKSLKLILPEEKVVAFNLLKTKSSQFIRLLVEKNNFVYNQWLALIDIIKNLDLFPELSNQLLTPLFEHQKFKPLSFNQQPSKDEQNQQVRLIASSIQKSLTNKNLAYRCLLPYDLASDKDKKNFLSFKLWLHTNFYDGLAKITQVRAVKINSYLVLQYQKSAYQVLYNFCEYLKQASLQNFSNIHRNNLKKQLTWYVKNKQAMETLSTIGEFYLGLENKKTIFTEKKQIDERLGFFRRGWTNFFANSFLMYYAKNQPLTRLELLKTINFKRFKLLIYSSSLEKLGQKSTALTAFFIHLFRLTGEDLTKTFRLLNPGDPLVDSWILRGIPDSLKNKKVILSMAKKTALRLL